MMNISRFLITMTLGLFSLSLSALAQEGSDKIGSIDMNKLVKDFYKTAETSKIFRKYEEDIKKQNDVRLEGIRALVEEAKKLQKQGEEPALDREKKNEIFQQLSRKQQEVQGLDRERVSWLQRKQAALNEKAKIDYGKVRLEIVEKVREYGDAEGYDFIFDRSGLSGAGVAILSYSKDATDLTPALLAAINQGAPQTDSTEEETKESE